MANKKRKNQKIGKRLRKHSVRLIDDALGIVGAVGNPRRVYKAVRKTIKKRPALSAAAALAAAAAIWMRGEDEESTARKGAVANDREAKGTPKKDDEAVSATA